ncbi:MAG: pseudouridylate synthase [Ectothiorhodospiraceae bacterium]|nr:pseudouridylate synthase [Ectothiorhodospiraceae bacterium]
MDSELALPIVYQDTDYVAVDKPHGLLVHRTHLSGSRDAALQRLRNQLGRRVYPIHRLDRPTSGVLVFALNPDAARALAQLFESRRVEKHYLAVCRGWTEETGLIDHPIGTGDHRQAARTRYRRRDTVELPIPVGPYPAARYSLVDVWPETGRMHQIRRHFAHIRHPLIGDTTHGEGRHNRLFRQYFQCHHLLLRADRLAFPHPFREADVCIHAPLPERWKELFRALGWQPHIAREQGCDPARRQGMTEDG